MARYHAFGNLAVTAPANNSFTNNSRPVISGPGDANATVKVWVDGVEAGTHGGGYRRHLELHSGRCVAEGAHTVYATETGCGGPHGGHFEYQQLHGGHGAAVGPGGATPANGAFVNNTRPYIGGTAEAYSTVAVYLDEVAVGTVTANGTGAWGFVPASRTGRRTPHGEGGGDRPGRQHRGVFNIHEFRSNSITSGTPGNLDTGFGTGGIVTTAIGSGDDMATGVVAQIDGKIVVAGTSYNGSNKDFALARYNPDGTLDTSFNGTGKVTTDFRGNDDFCNGVVLQNDGKIVVVGYSSDGTRNDFALARYNTDGTLDTGFGQAGTGKVVTTGMGIIGVSGNSEAYAVANAGGWQVGVVGRLAV